MLTLAGRIAMARGRVHSDHLQPSDAVAASKALQALAKAGPGAKASELSRLVRIVASVC